MAAAASGGSLQVDRVDRDRVGAGSRLARLDHEGPQRELALRRKVGLKGRVVGSRDAVTPNDEDLPSVLRDQIVLVRDKEGQLSVEHISSQDQTLACLTAHGAS